MSAAAFERASPLTHTLLYEGYTLFPYSASALKNRKRCSFGELLPGGSVRLELPFQPAGDGAPRVTLRLSLLQPQRRTVRDAAGETVSALDVGEERYASFVEVREHSEHIGPLALDLLDRALTIEIPGHEGVEAIRDAEGAEVGSIRRTALPLRLRLELRSRAASAGSVVFSASLQMSSADPVADPELSALHAPHLLAFIDGGRWVSMIHLPGDLRPLVDACESDRWWPVLVDRRSDGALALLSPIILYDYPELAGESPIDLFDATENDELLTLSILSLTEDERRSMRAVDPRARAILERAGEPAALGALHGAIRAFDPATTTDPGRSVQIGDIVILSPRGTDAFDAALDGKRAKVVDSVTEVTGREFLVVVLLDDPGRDLGESEVGLGHRFFLGRSEVKRADAFVTGAA